MCALCVWGFVYENLAWAIFGRSLLLLFAHQVVSNSFELHVLQHARPPCPSLSPEVCPSSCPLNRWCHLTISSCATLFSFCSSVFPSIGVFPSPWCWGDLQWLQVINLWAFLKQPRIIQSKLCWVKWVRKLNFTIWTKFKRKLYKKTLTGGSFMKKV